MPRDIRTYLHDVLVAGGLIRRFVSGRSLVDYEDDPMLRSAVERQFEVIGEALRRAVETNPGFARRSRSSLGSSRSGINSFMDTRESGTKSFGPLLKRTSLGCSRSSMN